MLSSCRLGIQRLRSPGTAQRVGRVVHWDSRFSSVRRPAIKSPSRCTSTLPPLMRLARLATWRAYSMGSRKGWVKRMVESRAKLEFWVFLAGSR